MKKLVVLGAGTAGTMVVNKLSHLLDREAWKITLVDQDETHYYQPGFLFIPFGIYGRNDVIKPKRDFIPPGVELIVSEIELIEPEHQRVRLVKDQRSLSYDFLIIATGTQPRPEETPGLHEGEWRKSVHDFYIYEGALALAKHLRTWQGGRLVVNIMEVPLLRITSGLRWSPQWPGSGSKWPAKRAPQNLQQPTLSTFHRPR
jgi:sulfide:quinone oxidoreductase